MKSVLRNLKDPVVKKFVQFLLVRGYENYSISQEIPKKIIEFLEQNYESPAAAIKRIYAEMHEFKDENSVFLKGRKNYSSRKIRYLEMFKFVKNELKNGIILEVGCGENYFGSIVVKKCPVKKYIGTDVYAYKHVLENEKLEFRKQNKPLVIPVEDRSVDTLFIVDMIHHVNRQNQEELLQEAFSKLKPDGKGIIIEYTFSEKEKSSYERKIANKFKMLSRKQKFMIMEVIDWIGNILVKSAKINMPYAYRTMEEWEQIFKKMRISAVRSRYLGFLTRLFHIGPYSLFIIKN